MTTANQTPTFWQFEGRHISGQRDRVTGEFLADILTGFFFTATDCEESAKYALAARYAGIHGEYRLVSISKLEMTKYAAKMYKRGGTKDMPVLA